MSVRFDKPWQNKNEALARLKGQMGVFQLGDDAGEVLFMSFAGGHSLHGLKGEVAAALERHPQATCVRYEVTTAYVSRFREAMMAHIATYGVPAPTDKSLTLGRISPAG